MLLAGGKAQSAEEARQMLETVVQNGKALEKLEEFVTAQGGDARAVRDTSLLPQAMASFEIPAPMEGYVSGIVCDEIGICCLMLGGGRETKESEIDLSVGFVIHKKVGDYVSLGESLATMYYNDEEKAKAALERFQKAYSFSSEKPLPRKLIKGKL